MMTALRSLLFNVFFFLWTLALSLLFLPLLLLPRAAILAGARLWARGTNLLLRVLVGLSYEVRGRENLPQGPCLIAPKHQSAWETLTLNLLLPNPAFILKRELFSIPFIGWYLRKAGSVGIDRGAGAAALKQMLKGAKERLGEGRPVVIFPEGTRAAPGASHPYHPGVAGLYAHCGVPVVPVALNSGLFWGRRSFLKRPGTLTVAFLPPMPEGLNRRAFMAELEARIESATARLIAESGIAPTVVEKLVEE